jgi:hypothetical protein
MPNPVRTVRLTGNNSGSLNTVTAQNGEIFYDQTNKTLRLFDGRVKGGIQLLRADLSNITGSFGVTVSSTPPSNAQQGSQWLNTTSGVLYVYYVDVNGGHWMQPLTSPIGAVTPPVTLFAASIEDLGGVIVDGTSVIINGDGVISAVVSSSFVDSNFIGITTTQLSANILNSISGAFGTVEHNILTAGTVFYHTGVVSNFVANFTSVPTTDNRSTAVSLVISQNNPAYICNGVQINGAVQTINWENSIEPTGNIGNTDLITFTLIRTNNTWLVTGSLSTHGEI